ncbi:TPA: energy transducer TonB [Candidatus Latescibacteria bacterium]|nr:energy transducer TonB [Gemmatimonadota bacterium]HAA74813.1 energy transducer TonB [Candidatus Latescibacterota bacterium]|tara:strand:- start:5796 stop:6443 length:648 start_codon:yes stop_codon:yes gene_type:complete
MAMVRGKNPEHDLRLRYRKVFWISTSINFVLSVTMAVLFPEFNTEAAAQKKDQIIINMEDIPETRQIQRPPPPPRPAVPIETESDDVPDDVTIESTDLDFDDAMVDLPPPPPPGSDEMEEEVLEFFMVEEKPTIVKNVNPVYPEIARKAGLSGRVFVRFKVGKDGRVHEVQILKGEEIFRQAAIDAVSQFVFKPAYQNDKPVAVWMSQAIKFDLN